MNTKTKYTKSGWTVQQYTDGTVAASGPGEHGRAAWYWTADGAGTYTGDGAACECPADVDAVVDSLLAANVTGEW